MLSQKELRWMPLYKNTGHLISYLDRLLFCEFVIIYRQESRAIAERTALDAAVNFDTYRILQ